MSLPSRPPAWHHSVGGAAFWTLMQQGSFFACAWGVSWWAGAEHFGAFGQGLALVAMLSAAITLRLEYAGQIERRERRASALFVLAERAALVCSVLLLAALGVASLWLQVPWWLWASALALLPQSGVLVRAAEQARRGDVVRAAALRAAPALLMIVLLVLAWALGRREWIEWTIPASAWLSWGVLRWQSVEERPACARGTAGFHLPFVRAELPGFLLNVCANHGQVLLIGALGGDAAAGVAALALRIAMLPTSVFGLALTDRLRARVVAVGRGAALRTMLQQAIRRMAALSVGAHLVGAVLVPVVVPWAFPGQGAVLVHMVLWLLPLGAIRLVASPLAFLLPWRGWLGLSLLGQVLLFASALCSVVLGFPIAGLMGVAVCYAISAAIVYLGYVLASTRAVRADT